MTSADLLTDGFGRIRESVENATAGLSASQLAERLTPDANPVSWLIWHLARVQDDHVSKAFGVQQEWVSGQWATRFGLPPQMMDHGYGHTSAEVSNLAAAVTGASPSPGKLLVEYYDAVHAQTIPLVSQVTDADLERVVDLGWDPPVTLGVRLVSVLDDAAQHVGQAAYVRGILVNRA